MRKMFNNRWENINEIINVNNVIQYKYIFMKLFDNITTSFINIIVNVYILLLQMLFSTSNEYSIDILWNVSKKSEKI